MKIGERFNPFGLFVGAFIPNWLAERKDVSQGAKLCYARLCEHAGKNGEAFPSHEAIAHSIGVRERQIRNYVRELEQLGLIEFEKRGRGQTNIYFFVGTLG